jgi:hypothetical protein
MTLISLLNSGTIIDLDSVALVAPTQPASGASVGNGVKIVVAGVERSLWGDDARDFLTQLQTHKRVDAEKLMKWVPTRSH